MTEASRKNKSSQLNMSWLELECILPYLDVHKRLSISICSQWFRNLEKQTYIYFDELEIESSKIKINNKHYKIGECLDVEKISELDDRNAKRIKTSIQSTNFQGGNEWMSMEDDLLEPGDILLHQSSDLKLEQQKIDIMNKLRHSFMEELEKYSNSAIMVNPLDVFEHSVTECDYEWPTELKRMFERIYRSLPFYLYNVFWKHPLLENEDRSPVQQDDLSKMYLNAFNLMNSKIEEMKRNNDVRVYVLEMLAYPPVTVPHFNQFTVLGISPEYFNRIPDIFSIRKAFKHFLSVILTGRKNIGVGKFKLEGHGIIPLPVGLKFDCEEVDFSLLPDDGSSTKAYDALVRKVNRINIPSYSGCMEYGETLKIQMVRNCKKLHLPSFEMDRIGSEFKFVDNEVLFIEIRFSKYDRGLVDIIRSWTSNTDRSVGSKLFIAYTENPFPPNTDVAIRLRKLREMGFRMKENFENSMYLLQTENKRVELTFLKNYLLVPQEFLQRNRSDHYCSLEIVGSK